MEMNESLQGRVILVETAENKWRCEDNPEIKKNIGSVVVYTYDEVKANESQIIGGISNNKLEIRGRTYIYDDGIDKFVLNDSNVDINLYKEKINIFVDFLRLLGAVKFEGEVRISEEDKSKLNNKTKIKAKTVKADVDVCLRSESELKQYLKLSATMNGRNLTDEEYGAAVDFYNASPMLKNNSDCWIMLRGRNPKENEYKKYKVSLCLSANLQSSIDVASSLSAIKLFSVKNDFTKERIVNKNVSVNFEVEFK